MKEQQTAQGPAGKYQDLNHYFVSQEKIRLKLSGGGAKKIVQSQPTPFLVSPLVDDEGNSTCNNTRIVNSIITVLIT